MKKTVFIFLFLSITKICMGEVNNREFTNFFADNNSFFNSRLQSTTTDFNENISTRSEGNACPMCGGFSLGGGTCGSCSYSLGSGLGASERNVPIHESVYIYLMCILFYGIFVSVRLRYKSHKK